MIYRLPPDFDWSFAPKQGKKRFNSDTNIFELSHPFSLSRIVFICVCLNVRTSPASSVAAGNPLQLCYQECPVCPYKGKLTCGFDTSEFKALIRSAAWLHSNLQPALEIITVAHFRVPPTSHTHARGLARMQKVYILLCVREFDTS